MKINSMQRTKVIRLFLDGITYDDIAKEVGIAKGSVVSIIYDFREGRFSAPADMTHSVNALRQLAVDLRKNSTNIATVKSCLKIFSKLQQMEVTAEQSV